MAEQKVLAYAALDESGHLSPFEITRRATGEEDIALKVTHCGICHSDLHQIRNDWKMARYPMVPGHEIVGIVSEVGSKVKGFQVGDHVGVGCLVRSCGECEPCARVLENYCDRKVLSFNHVDYDGTPTHGGFSTLMVANQKFVFRIPSNLPLDEAAPLLCAGITVYSPMKYLGIHKAKNKGKKLGVVGLGGLGHMAVKFGKAFGLDVTVISTSPNKEEEAKKVLGVDHFLVSKDEAMMKQAAKSLHYIIDTVSATHPLDPLLNLLTLDGKMVLVGIPEHPLELIPLTLLMERRFVGGSIFGGTIETQEMLDFCGECNITCNIEKIPMSYVNTAMDRLHHGDVKYRFVVDIANTLKA